MDEFEGWWKEYPKKLAKGDARKAWLQTAKIRPSTAKLIKAVIVARTTEQWTKDGGQFIPYPATWLRQERWEDVHEVDLQSVVNGKVWWQTASGLEARALELNIAPWDGQYGDAPESWKQWAERVKRAAGVNVVPLVKSA